MTHRERLLCGCSALLRGTLLVSLLLFMVGLAAAWDTVTVRNIGNITSADAEFDGSNVNVSWDFSDRDAGVAQAALSELDIESADLEEGIAKGGNQRPYTMRLECKSSQKCVHGNVDRLNRIPVDSVLGPFTTDTLYIQCESAAECAAFLHALRGDSHFSSPRGQSSQTGSGDSTTQRPPSMPTLDSPSTMRSQTLATSDLHDLLASLGWLSSGIGAGSGKNALDSLVKQLKSRTGPVAAPATKPTYAAFSQAGGFDANGAWGVGTHKDLNSAIAAAESNCEQRATLCEDEGYCALLPGVWGAWASDLKVAGNSAFTCNVETEDEARARAQSWCGTGCKVLWSGVGQ